ncbi:hypothetical protein [Ornithinimicrobium kibberense]|uniref:hypothetical protein n=1 Tax=Ornithinimicrobium kibberense TaxID=282060 RepID=UPI00360812EC
MRRCSPRVAIWSSAMSTMDPATGCMSMPRHGPCQKWMSPPRRPRSSKARLRMSPTRRSWSTVRLVVAASTKLASRAGLVKVSRESALSMTALTNCIWRSPREMSPWLSE